MEKVAQIAEAWALECGLKPPFTSQVAVKEFGFVVDVTGKNGEATCHLLKDGARSMYDLRQRYGEEGRR